MTTNAMTPTSKVARRTIHESRLMLVARALKKSGGTAELAEVLGVSRGTVYFWCDFQSGPSKENVEKLLEYLAERPKPSSAPVSAPPMGLGAVLKAVVESKKEERAEGKRSYNLPAEMEVHEVVVERHAYSKSGARIIFGSTVETNDRVFVPPHTTDKLLAKLNGVIPINTVFKGKLTKDISGRSGFIAQEVM